MPKAHAEHAQKISKEVALWRTGTPADTMNDEQEAGKRKAHVVG